MNKPQPRTIVRDAERYADQFVATPGFHSDVVVASGPDPTKVYEEAKQKGYEHPVIVFVPPKGAVCIW